MEQLKQGKDEIPKFELQDLLIDLETLELLEEQLVEWPGTLLLVSHDRVFLDNVVTSTTFDVDDK